MDLLQQFQNFSSFEWKGMKPGLERISKACGRMDHPEKKFPSLHIAGTNGKGSVAAMLHSVLSEAGWKVGLFTSPHLMKVNERFRVGDQEISDEELEGILKRMGEHGADLTFFELCTLIAFLHFAEKKVDVAVLETGLGGRWDATNVVTPLVSVITEISLDHTEVLGGDLASIAGEKAGIIKPGVPVVCGAREEAALSVIRRAAEEKRAPFILPELPTFSPREEGERQIFHWGPYRSLALGLKGRHQLQNAGIALKTLEVLKQRGAFPISESALRRGLEKVAWPGRLEWMSHEPPVLLDGAHNPSGVRALAEYLKEQSPLKWKILFSSARDKPINEMLKVLRAVSDEITVCSMANPRSLDPQEISEKECFRAGKDAYGTYRKILGGLKKGEGLAVTGSLYLIGEIKQGLTDKSSV